LSPSTKKGSFLMETLGGSASPSKIVKRNLFTVTLQNGHVLFTTEIGCIIVYVVSEIGTIRAFELMDT
jgi:hypothetical protein